MIELEMYSDYACPWCYFLIPDIEMLIENDGIYVKRRAFQILPEIPLDGMSVEQYDQMRGNTLIDRKKKNDLTINITHRKNLPWYPRKNFYQTFPAHTLAKWVEDQNNYEKVTEYHTKVYNHVYGLGENIAHPEVLLAVLNSMDYKITKAEVEDLIAYPLLKERVYQDINSARALSVSGVPYFTIYNENTAERISLPGYYEYDSLEAFAQGNYK